MDKKNSTNESGSKDAAWTVLHTPLSVTELRAFCRDIERLFRINPMLNFRNWQRLETDRYRFSGQNISQQPPFDFDLTLTVKQLPDGLQIDYDQGLKSHTTLIIEAITDQLEKSDQIECHSKLTITDYYDGLPECKRAKQLHLVDKSISVWANDLQRYLIGWHYWSRYRLWRWYMQYVWQPMKPMGRRITTILLWITVVELALILLGSAIYFLEYTE